MLHRVPVFVLMLAGCTLAQADVFRWVDDHGVPHYSDQWVPGSEVIKTGKIHPDSNSLASTSGGSRARMTAQTQMADDSNTRAVQQDLAKTRDAQCKKAEAAYTDSITHRRVFKTDAGGNRTYLSDAELDSYREQTRKDAMEFCGKVPVIDPNQPIEPKPVPEPKVNPADATTP